jgi:molybdenum cofactor guanylyltransferase
MDISDITGVVLAGGTNSRYGGKIKANEIIGGEKIISSILKVIRPLFGEVVIVTNTPEAFSDITGCIITGDHFLKRGPLGGIHAAMNASSKDAVFVFAGDMPFLNRDLIISQAMEYCSDPVDVLIPRLKGNIEPLHSVYSTKLVDKLEDFLSEGSDNMIRSFLHKLSVRYFNVPENEAYTRSFVNINSHSDLQRIKSEVLTPSPLGEGRVRGLPSQERVRGLNSILEK